MSKEIKPSGYVMRGYLKQLADDGAALLKADSGHPWHIPVTIIPTADYQAIMEWMEDAAFLLKCTALNQRGEYLPDLNVLLSRLSSILKTDNSSQETRNEPTEKEREE